MGRRLLKRNPAFSLLELLTVVVIIGVLLTFAVPSYNNMIEKNRAKNAEFNLVAIYNAQKRHHLSQKTYYPCRNTPCTTLELEDEDHLGVFISDPYFNYTITAGVTAFTATATRQGGSLCNGEVMNITQAGSNVTKGCDIW